MYFFICTFILHVGLSTYRPYSDVFSWMAWRNTYVNVHMHVHVGTGINVIHQIGYRIGIIQLYICIYTNMTTNAVPDYGHTTTCTMSCANCTKWQCQREDVYTSI